MTAGGFLEVRGLSKRFGATPALDGVDLNVGADELIVVLGPTGAGKTTLLRCLAGLEQPEAGSIAMRGRDVTRASPASRDVALVFQNFSLYPRWSVRRNLEFPLRAPGRNLAAGEIAERVGSAAAMLRIGHLLDRPASRLSGGEMQRVAIGRAIVRRPALFLMDEPLTNLDAKLREALRAEIVELRRRLGTPMVLVTHDQAEALSMADAIVVLSGGRVLQVGAPEDVYRRPASPEVARQLGQPPINLFAAARSGGDWIASSGAVLAPARAGSGDRATVGVRPEDVALDGGTVPGTVLVVEDMGPFRTLLVRWGGAEIHVSTGGPRSIRSGDVVHPRIDPARATVWE